jgi:hypothetical protein
LKVPWYWLLGLFLMTMTAGVLAAGQTSLWYLVFGRFPAPMFWLIALVYMSVTRPLWEATLFTYLLVCVISPFTIFPLSSFLIFCLLLMTALMLIRERVFWGGSTYFMLMVAVASVVAPLVFWAVSRWTDKRPVSMPDIFEWLIAGLLTTLLSLPFYRLYQWFDRLAAQDAGNEGRVGPR